MGFFAHLFSLSPLSLSLFFLDRAIVSLSILVHTHFSLFPLPLALALMILNTIGEVHIIDIIISQ